MRQAVCPITDDSAVGAARRRAALLADEAGLSETDRGRVGIVATELARNIVLHSGHGELLLQRIREGDAIGVEVLGVDAGPGMTDLDECLRDGYSTRGTLGHGLGAVVRMSSEFDAYTRAGHGVIVMSRIFGANVTSAPGMRWGAVSSCAPGENQCGDRWSLTQRDGDVAVMVADGLGHGPAAAEAADRAAEVFEVRPFRPFQEFFEEAHRVLRSTRGAAVAVAQYEASVESLRYAGVGNIASTLVHADGNRRGLVSLNGTVGAQMRHANTFSYDWPEGDLLVMCSDGLKTGWSLQAYPGLVARHPAVIAAALHRDFRRGRDDTTIVVVRRGG